MFDIAANNQLRVDLSKVLSFVLTATLVLVASLRGDTSDSYGYMLLYEHLKDANVLINPFEFYLLNGVEWTFGFASLILGNLNFSYVALFFTYSSLSFLLLFKICKRIHINYNIFLIYYIGYYFITQQLTFMRYGFAVILAYYFFIYTIQERMSILKYIFMLAALMLVHIFVSFLFLLFILIKMIESPARGVLKFTHSLSFLVFSLIALTLAKYSIQILPLERVIFYLENEEIGVYTNLFSVENLKAVFLLFIFSFVLLGRRISLELRYLYLAYLLSVVVRFVFYDIGVLSSRAGYLLGFSEVFILLIIVPRYINSISGQCVVGIAYVFAHRFFAQTYSTSELIDLYMTPIK